LSFWNAFQIIFDLFVGFGIGVLLLKLARAPKDDPRLSRGLQILQSKIAILEDLSDRTENQVRGLMQLLDQKNIEVQARIDKAGEQVRIVEESIRSSLEVAKIFQDKIPHQEIIERKNTLKYLQAARLANQGRSANEIAKIVDLPLGEIEFIAKVNSEQLTFSMDELPAWARAELAQIENSQAQAEANPTFAEHAGFAQSPERPNENTNGFVENQVPRHFYSSDLNYLGDSLDREQKFYSPSSEISPLAAFSSEPQFQAFENFKFQQEMSPQAVTREMTAQESKQLSTLKRTQSIIANLDKQFSLSGVDVEDELPRPPPPITAPEEAMPSPAAIPAPRASVQAVKESRPRDATHVSNRSQSSSTYDLASIRKVVFPTIASTKASSRAGGR